jgi:hypothetical protein
MNWRAITYLVWGFVLAGFVLIELAARRARFASPLSDVVGALTSRTSLRLVVVLAWMWLGWHAFAR